MGGARVRWIIITIDEGGVETWNDNTGGGGGRRRGREGGSEVELGGRCEVMLAVVLVEEVVPLVLNR